MVLASKLIVQLLSLCGQDISSSFQFPRLNSPNLQLLSGPENLIKLLEDAEMWQGCQVTLVLFQAAFWAWVLRVLEDF